MIQVLNIAAAYKTTDYVNQVLKDKLPRNAKVINTQYIQNGAFTEYAVFYEVPDEEEDKDLKTLLKDLESLSEHREAIEGIVDSRIKEKLDSILEQLDLLDKVVKELISKAPNQPMNPPSWPPLWATGMPAWFTHW